MSTFDDALASARAEYALVQSYLSASDAARDAALAEVARLRAELDALQNPAAHVMLGCSQRFFSDFQLAVTKPLKAKRIFTARATPPLAGWAVASDCVEAGIRPLVDFRRVDGETDASFKTRVQAIAAHVADWPIKPLGTFTAEMERAEKNITPEDFIRLHRLSYEVLHEVMEIAWCPMAASYGNGTALAYYPGYDAVDVVACDGYAKGLQDGKYVTPEWIFTAAVDFAWFHAKPFAILEYGVQTNLPGGTPALRAQWIDEFHEWAKTVPLSLACYWESSTAGESYEIRSEPETMAAFNRMAEDPWFQA